MNEGVVCRRAVAVETEDPGGVVEEGGQVHAAAGGQWGRVADEAGVALVAVLIKKDCVQLCFLY